MTREEQIMNDPNLARYVDKQRGWIHEAFMDGVRWADDNRPVDWQQVRIRASIAAMQGITSNPYFTQEFDRISKTVEQVRERAAIISVEFADALVKELKGE